MLLAGDLPKPRGEVQSRLRNAIAERVSDDARIGGSGSEIMVSRDAGKRKNVIDMLAEAATPKLDRDDVSGQPAWWWIFFMPGKVILWIEYMFPERFWDRAPTKHSFVADII